VREGFAITKSPGLVACVGRIEYPLECGLDIDSTSQRGANWL
jgi:hypothetical protein